MQQKHILIFAKTAYSKTPYDQWLAGTGIEPIILTTEEFAPGYRHLPNVHAFSEYDRNQCIAKTALEIGRKTPLVGVFARAEADILRAAELRELLSLPGQRPGSALAFRNKVLMKDTLRHSGVLLPHYRALDSAFTAIQFIEKYGYPVVIKPFSESGSSGVHVIRNEADLDRYLAQPASGEMEIETFVEGQMYHVDGLILDGELVFIHPFEYINTCLAFRMNEANGTFTLSSAHPAYKPLVEATRKVLSALPSPRHMAFHAEFWRTPKDEIVFCEIASRTGGGMISSTIHYSFGINVDKEWLYAECGLPRTFDTLVYRPGGGLILPPQNGTLEHLPSGNEPSYVREAQLTGSVGQRFHGGVKSGLFLAGYVVGGNTEDEVVQHMSEAAAWFARESKWSA